MSASESCAVRSASESCVVRSASESCAVRSASESCAVRSASDPSHTTPFAYPPLVQGVTKRGYIVEVGTMLAH